MGEAGSALIHDYSDKLWELVQVFKGLNAAVMVLVDTHAQAEEAEVIKSMRCRNSMLVDNCSLS